ncbi:MAG TPA: hemerythrin domain-containing protein [Actinomycetales bacterium]|jgi:hemerythrin-like domain-containing protein|nr:hemerythrin domain-containing protein [Actinomycetales bacterium]
MTYPTQLELPGQTHVAEGPYDQTGMYVMHHAFRRDLDRFVSAARNTPVEEAEVWHALVDRWARFDSTLHHHHTIEDEAIWPVLLRHVGDNPAERETLEAMEAEHAQIDPGLAACRSGFGDMVAHPCDDHRNALVIRLTAVRQALLDHLRHEESETLPLLQRTMTREEWDAAEAAAQKGYPVRDFPFLVPWALDELPEDGRRRMLRDAGRAYGILWRIVRRRYERRDAVAFRYA